MKTLRYVALGVAVALSGPVWVHSAHGQEKGIGSARERLIGAWHLVSISGGASDEKAAATTEIKGTLIYTRDGHMSVQLMYPPSAASLNNDYVRNGYEASFGTYDVNEAAHTITHHVQGSITPGLVGKDLPRAFVFSDTYMIITSTRPEEHWSATWERD